MIALSLAAVLFASALGFIEGVRLRGTAPVSDKCASRTDPECGYPWIVGGRKMGTHGTPRFTTYDAMNPPEWMKPPEAGFGPAPWNSAVLQPPPVPISPFAVDTPNMQSAAMVGGTPIALPRPTLSTMVFPAFGQPRGMRERRRHTL